MAGFFDSAVDWLSSNSDTLISAGQTAYSMYNQQQAAGTLKDATAPGGITDPFGAERPKYQQKLAALYNDPSYLQNLPGYKFQQQMGEQAVNRGAAKSGHFGSPNRLYELSKFNQGLAETSYNNEATRLAHLAGAGIQPNAGAMLTGTEGLANANTQTAAQGGGLLQTVLGMIPTGGGAAQTNPTEAGPESGPNGQTDFGSATTGNSWEGLSAALSLGGGAVERAEQLSGLAGDADMGGADFANYYDSQTQLGGVGGLVDDVKQFAAEYGLDDLDYGSMGMRLASGEDPKEILKDEAINYAKEKGEAWVKGEGADLFSDATGIDLGSFGLGESFSAAQQLGSEAVGRASDLSGLVGNADLGGVNTGYTAGGEAGSLAGVSNAVNIGSAVGGVVGGIGVNYLATKYIDDNPVIGTLSSIGGSIAGAGVGGAIGGAVAGTGAAAGASAGIALAGAAAGPLAIAAAVYVIGSGIYGHFKSASDKDQQRDDYRRVTGEATHGAEQVADPTGQSLGLGSIYSNGGHEFFLPASHYENLKQKNMVGEYFDVGQWGQLDTQGNYGYYHDQNDDTWHSGKFAGAGAQSMDWNSWRAVDMKAEDADWAKKVDMQHNPQKYSQWIAGEGDAGRKETQTEVTARNTSSGGWQGGEGASTPQQNGEGG